MHVPAIADYRLELANRVGFVTISKVLVLYDTPRTKNYMIAWREYLEKRKIKKD